MALHGTFTRLAILLLKYRMWFLLPLTAYEDNPTSWWQSNLFNTLLSREREWRCLSSLIQSSRLQQEERIAPPAATQLRYFFSQLMTGLQKKKKISVRKRWEQRLEGSALVFFLFFGPFLLFCSLSCSSALWRKAAESQPAPMKTEGAAELQSFTGETLGSPEHHRWEITHVHN